MRYIVLKEHLHKLIPVDRFKGYFFLNVEDIYFEGRDELYERKGKVIKRHLKSGVLWKCKSDGYYVINIRNSKYRVHRLIAEQFIPNPENKPCINHKNGNKLDNRIENLEWCTTVENNKHAWRVGLCRGKLTMQDAKEIRDRYKNGESIRKIAYSYAVSNSCIANIVKNKTYKQIELKTGEIYIQFPNKLRK